MKGKNRRLPFAPVMVLSCLLLAGCGKPSKKDAEAAVRQSLERWVPVTLAGWLSGGEHATVEEVRVIQIGKAQGSGANRRWPVKIYAQGTCAVMFGGRKAFAGETEYLLSRDTEGKWVADPAGL